MSGADFEYIIVGSGAGGGPLAANLARAGFRVLLLEAGGDPCSESELGRLMYEVPIFHGLSTEFPPLSWDYFVRHYTNEEQQWRDSKAVPFQGKPSVWYPRAGGLGGCTAHNAMIAVAPQASDWNNIARITGDDSWSAAKMAPYFERVENCQYVGRPGTLCGEIDRAVSEVEGLLERDPGWRDWRHGHGFDGWLSTSEANPTLALKDPEIVRLILDAAVEALRDHVGDPLFRAETFFDPNDSRNAAESPEGLAFTPMAVKSGHRVSPRDYVLSTKRLFPGNLTVQTNSLATRILFDGLRATGVEFIEKPHAYAADPNAAGGLDGEPRRQVSASREVIVCAGAFNSPQLLMLSGIGPRAELDRHGIPVLVDLPGVGSNLQDRYEVGVISRFERNFELIGGATFAPPVLGEAPDAFFAEWHQRGTGVYATNGALIGIIKRSRAGLTDPDLYIFGLPGQFGGYKPGYSKLFERHHNRFTWAILKARTSNRGRVRLASAKPWDMPEVNFQYFGDGQRANDPDLDAVVSGVRFARAINARLGDEIQAEELPGPAYATDEQLREFIRNEAWGHHASCTLPIGADDDAMAVLDSRFCVRGARNLRVVDASVFPRIPGYFIVTPIYMVSEKAAAVVIADASAASRSIGAHGG